MRQKIRDLVVRAISTLLPKGIMTNPRYFQLWEKKGYHITPVHFYQPIPDTRELGDELWTRRSALVGIETNDETQLQLLSLFADRYKNEYDKFPEDRTSVLHEFYLGNPAFKSVDAEVLYCMIRHYKPKRILEIGSGFTTYLSAKALLKNKQEDDGYECELVAIEPYPNDTLKAGFPGLSRLITDKLQDVPPSVFQELEEDDILFIDSSHVLKLGSDVQYEYLEIIPRLAKGVLVHIHDIFMPAEYLKEWVMKYHFFYNEQYVLQAFLSFNNSFEVMWMGSYMHLKYPDKLESAFPAYTREERWPGSLWIKRTGR